MSKETAKSTTSTTAAAPATPATTAKTTKTKTQKVVVPLTEAQKKAQAALEAANAEARQALVAQSADKIKDADLKIKNAEEVLKKAKAEKTALLKSIGVKGGAAKKVNRITYVKDFPADKGAPQAKQILEIVKAGGKDGVPRDKVVETMKTVIKTDMDRSRLLSFYTSKMVAAGVISVA